MPTTTKPIPELSEEDKARFLSKVNKDGPTMPHMETPCWVWTAYKNKHGYGGLVIRQRSLKAHRVSWYIAYGEPSIATPFVLHRCDNPPCCNPSHLFVGTNADNMDDMVKKGRVGTLFGDDNASRRFPESRPRGEVVHSAILTSEEVTSMRSAYKAGGVTITQLGKMFGLSRAASGKIINGNTWKHLL